MLNSSYGLTHITPPDFSSLLSSCSVPATRYSYSTPSSSVTPTGTSSSTASAAPTCTGTSYTAESGDTYASIARANSVATDRFVTGNHLDYNCTAIAPGAKLCLPQSCLLYLVETNDTCAGITADESFYLNQLLSWNPSIHQNYDNLDSMIGRTICISPPGTTSWTANPANISSDWNV
ncbi:hypothetical protein B0T26DRAFT_293818 [Lasiosphaeria miniovina]|uniref:LysM domain-containing protein n=1 Tax=Lasiosphaeria miniovina TaxID=1954250 RepID=A0AA40AK88_9PEZI|nr:uncharacterized protein B0T26DRAFT_293818 [Lasiosphaeria miniovina]KAK0717315.1 hypothetical protein B0T26DRAFT_293818 [Lasiosphaeria miniovina]